MINNLDAPSFEMQINFGALQIGTENSATAEKKAHFKFLRSFFIFKRNCLLLLNTFTF